MEEEKSGADMTLTRGMANHILQRMGESGQPPEQGIRFVNVGNEELLGIIDREYLNALLENSRGSAFKLVQGYFGGGKTHFLHCVRDLAWQRGFLTSTVNLTPTECPYEDPYKVYRNVVTNLCSAPVVAGSEPSRSLPDVLRDFVWERLGTDDKEKANTWIERTAMRIPVDNHTYRRAAAEYIRAVINHDTEGEAILEAWLRGDMIPRSELKRFGVYDVIEKANAFQSLCSMVQVLVGYGFPGVVILFDEADRNLSTTEKHIHQIGDNLRQVIDMCGSSKLPGVLFMYAVPPEFMRTIVPNYPALEQRLKSPLSMGRRSPQSVLIDLENLGLEPSDLLKAIGVKILNVSKVAWDWNPTEAIQVTNINVLATVTANHTWETGHRREFVKCLISFLSQQHLVGETLLSDHDAEEIVGGQTAVDDGAIDDFEDF